MNKLSKQYHKALELHGRICVAAQGAQSYLWEMCSGLKEMRDGKLYKELGYRNFEEYCEKEHGFSRQNAHRYISIVENINPENVTSMLQIGSTKLYLLSTLSESEQEKITAENDVEDMTVKELEAEIRELKNENVRIENERARLDYELSEQEEQLRGVQETLKVAREKESILIEKNTALHNKVVELESRPIEVAVQEPSEDVRQLQMTIKKLEQTTDQQLDNLQNEHIRDIRELNDKHRAELDAAIKSKDDALEAQRRKYEKEIAKLYDEDDNTKEIFNIYQKAVIDSFDQLLDFVNALEYKSDYYFNIVDMLNEMKDISFNLIDQN